MTLFIDHRCNDSLFENLILTTENGFQRIWQKDMSVMCNTTSFRDMTLISFIYRLTYAVVPIVAKVIKTLLKISS